MSKELHPSRRPLEIDLIAGGLELFGLNTGEKKTIIAVQITRQDVLLKMMLHDRWKVISFHSNVRVHPCIIEYFNNFHINRGYP